MVKLKVFYDEINDKYYTKHALIRLFYNVIKSLKDPDDEIHERGFKASLFIRDFNIIGKQDIGIRRKKEADL